jgi:hypothetical protein
MLEQLPRPAPGGLCTRCRAPLFFARETRTLWCRRCRLSFRWADSGWDPYRDRALPAPE